MDVDKIYLGRDKVTVVWSDERDKVIVIKVLQKKECFVITIKREERQNRMICLETCRAT